jgi:hypothetical protein
LSLLFVHGSAAPPFSIFCHILPNTDKKCNLRRLK